MDNKFDINPKYHVFYEIFVVFKELTLSLVLFFIGKFTAEEGAFIIALFFYIGSLSECLYVIIRVYSFSTKVSVKRLNIIISYDEFKIYINFNTKNVKISSDLSLLSIEMPEKKELYKFILHDIDVNIDNIKNKIKRDEKGNYVICVLKSEVGDKLQNDKFVVFLDELMRSVQTRKTDVRKGLGEECKGYS